MESNVHTIEQLNRSLKMALRGWSARLRTSGTPVPQAAIDNVVQEMEEVADGLDMIPFRRDELREIARVSGHGPCRCSDAAWDPTCPQHGRR